MKTLVFLGRSHHKTRLNPLAQALEQLGHEAIAFTCNNAPTNTDPHTQDMPRPFLHASAYRIPPEADTTFLDFLGGIYGHGFLGSADIRAYVPPYWVVGGLREANGLLYQFRAMFEEERPDVLIGLHVLNFFFRIAAYVGMEMGIPVVVLQEGKLRLRDQQTMNKQSMAGDYVSKILVWSEQSKAEYVSAGIPEDKLVPVGILQLDQWLEIKGSPELYNRYREKMQQHLKIPDWPIVTFAFPLLGRYEGNPIKTMEEVVSWAKQKKLALVLKFHPFESEKTVGNVRSWLDGIGVDNVRVAKEGEATSLLMVSDLVLTQHSSVADEAVGFGVPVAEIDLDGVGVLESLSSQGVAIHIGKGDLDKLDKMLSGELVVDEGIRVAWCKDNLGPLDGQSSSRSVAIIERLVR